MMTKILRSPITTVVLFVLAAALLIGGGIGTAQSAPRIQSGDYRAQVQLTDIKTAILEKTNPQGDFVQRSGDDDLLTTFLADNNEDEIKIGKTYPYELAVRNSVSTENGIDQYVRVTVQKYWTDGKDQTIKHTDLDPDLIELHFVEGNGWTIDKKASTKERTVLYYADTLAPGEDSAPFTDTLTINGKVVTAVSQLADGTNEYDYEGLKFRIKAKVDAVQTHNGEEAMTSAWGRTNK